MISRIKYLIKRILPAYKPARKRTYREKAINAQAPELLISGTPEDRLHGLDQIFSFANGASLLDAGCHDGGVAWAFASHGITFIDGVDISPACINAAQRRFLGSSIDTSFSVCDLACGANSLRGYLRQSKYDFVCYLGVHHHLLGQMSEHELADFESFIFSMSSRFLIVRCPSKYMNSLHSRIVQSSFTLLHGPIEGPVGDLMIFQRDHS